MVEFLYFLLTFFCFLIKLTNKGSEMSIADNIRKLRLLLRARLWIFAGNGKEEK